MVKIVQELLEQRISAELKSVRASLVLVEKTAIDSLRSENEVSCGIELVAYCQPLS